LRQRLCLLGVLRLIDLELVHRERTLCETGVHHQHEHQPADEQ
jgi:hypothetical protein